ncbi:MobA/MobL family protein [Ochrobactrum pecoris]|nr:MobA/MobL family protein [Brucella pecoris]
MPHGLWIVPFCVECRRACRKARNDARVARGVCAVALPHELSVEGRPDLFREFAQDLANAVMAAALRWIFAIHAPHPDGDVRKPSSCLHVMMTTATGRTGGAWSQDSYRALARATKELLPQGLPST